MRESCLTQTSWCSTKPMPEAVILRLETRWPNARLYVANLVTKHPQLVNDILNYNATRLLSSRLLFSLDYGIRIFYPSGSRQTWPADLSELTRLQRIVHSSPRLQILRLRTLVKVRLGKRSPAWISRPAPRLQALRELQILGPFGIDSADENWTVWDNLLDWTLLRKLDLGGEWTNRLDFLCRFVGRVPNLKWLRFGVEFMDLVLAEGSEALRAFIESIHALEELFLFNSNGDPRLFYPSITRHRKTLRTILLHSPLAGVRQLLEPLQEGFQALRVLEIHVPLRYGVWWVRSTLSLALNPNALG